MNNERMKSSALTANTELRHLPPSDRNRLAQLLDVGDAWRELAAVIPKPDQLDGDTQLLLTSSNVRTLEQQKSMPGGGSPTQALLDYWGTSGRKRATLRSLVDLLVRCQLYQAADFVCRDVLHIELVKRMDEDEDEDSELKVAGFCDGMSRMSTAMDHTYLLDNHNRPVTPTAPIESLSSTCDNNNSDRHGHILSPHLEDTSITQFEMSELAFATNNFDETPLSEGGHKIGQGAFGSVFKGKLNDNNEFAIKRLNSEFEKQFLSELKIMSKLKHENLLSLCGIAVSHDGLCLCLIYEYMLNGSLFDRLSCAHDTPCLDWQTRVSIIIGTARGICHLHTFDEKPFVHRDIKSANILLDESFTPKVGDFGLARIGSSGASNATASLATTVIGTSVYMAPEAFRGDISVKLDTFSFGVVLLEILTGLLPYDEQRDEPDILSYLEEKINDQEEDEDYIYDNLIDKSAGNWNVKLAVQLYKTSKVCTEQRKKNRPMMGEVLQSLEQLINHQLQQ